MKVGDLVKWIGVAYPAGPGERIGIVLGKWVYDGDGSPALAAAHYWRVFMEGQTFNMDEQYLEVIHESR